MITEPWKVSGDKINAAIGLAVRDAIVRVTALHYLGDPVYVAIEDLPKFFRDTAQRLRYEKYSIGPKPKFSAKMIKARDEFLDLCVKNARASMSKHLLSADASYTVREFAAHIDLGTVALEYGDLEEDIRVLTESLRKRRFISLIKRLLFS